MSKKSLLVPLAAFGLLALAAPAAENVLVVLKNGSELRAEVLKEREDSLVLDLGSTILTLLRTDIARIEKEADKAAAGQKAAAQSEDMYFVEPAREAMTVEKNVQRVAEAVVQIQTASGLGSGFIINQMGHVITNQHVIAGEREITVLVYKKKQGGLEKLSFTKVKIIAMNGYLDLAILQIDDEKAVESLPFVPIGDSDALTQGQQVFAIGSPLGLERSVSQGIVSIRIDEKIGRNIQPECLTLIRELRWQVAINQRRTVTLLRRIGKLSKQIVELIAAQQGYLLHGGVRRPRIQSIRMIQT